MVHMHKINLGENGGSVKRHSEIQDVQNWVMIQLCDSSKGTVVATRAPITRGLGNHLKW